MTRIDPPTEREQQTMAPIFRTIFAVFTVLALTTSVGVTAGIECSKIGLAYDDLFVDANKRVQAILAEYKALPANAGEPKKEAVRKKFCAVAGELVGLYKVVRALANDCAKQGDQMTPLLDVVNKQLDLAEQGVAAPCK